LTAIPRTAATSARTGKSPFVSIVMPCLDEEQTIGKCVEDARAGLAAAGADGEVLVVDNGSTDGSAAAAARAGARVIVEPVRGKGRACATGFKAAAGEYLILCDADGTYDLSQLRLVIDALRDGSDMVVGNRFDGGISAGAMPWLHRYIGNPLISAFLRLASGSQVRDSLSGLRGFTRGALSEMGLEAGAFEIEAESVYKAGLLKLKVTEVPVAYHPRAVPSKLRSFEDGWAIASFVLVNAPHYLFTVTGAALLFAGVFAILSTYAFSSGVALGSLRWQPLFLATIFLVSGSNAILLGVAARAHAMTTGRIRDDKLVALYRRHLGLGRMLLAATASVLAGAVLDFLLFLSWVSEGSFDARLGTREASLAQCLIVIGVNLAFSCFLIEMLQRENGGPISQPAHGQ
jgi:glycosyltransferase involved in cell wall biosynthesis